MAYAATKLFAGWLNFVCQGRILLISPFPEVKKAVTLLGKIFLGFLVPLNHFQVPISSLLLLVPRNLLETHSYGSLQVSGLCELIYKNA